MGRSTQLGDLATGPAMKASAKSHAAKSAPAAPQLLKNDRREMPSSIA
jgi:hypothetical protein